MKIEKARKLLGVRKGGPDDPTIKRMRKQDREVREQLRKSTTKRSA